MSKSYTDPFTRADGALGSVPSGPAYSVLSGSFAIATNKATSSTAPGSNPLAVVPVGLRSNGKADAYSEINPSHVYGNAAFVRVSDVSNWVRARLRSYTSTYQYYITEYQHNTYVTEHLYNDYDWYDTWNSYVLQREVRTLTGCSYGGWGPYNLYSGPTACQLSPPSAPANVPGPYCGTQDTNQFRVVDNGTTGCTSPKHKYQVEKRVQSETPNYTYRWVNDPYTLGSNENFTGQTRTVPGSGSYTRFNGSASTTTPTSPSSSPAGPYDQYGGSFAANTGPDYWAQARESTGPTDPDTGSTRQTVSGSYWDQTYEAGAPTRQTGPYTGTNYYYGSIVLEKCVAGSVSQLGAYDYGSSTPYLMRLSTVGSQLTVTYNSSVLISVADAFNNVAGTNVGFGGGTSEYNATLPSLDDFKFGGISPERVLVGGAWQTMNRKILVAGAWVDFDSRVK